MKRVSAVITIVLGLVTVALAVSSHIHLRTLALSSTPIGLREHIDVRILTAGMLDKASSDTIDAAAFVRQLGFRIYAFVAAGLALILIGGTLLVLPRRSRPDRSDGTDSPTTCLANG